MYIHRLRDINVYKYIHTHMQACEIACGILLSKVDMMMMMVRYNQIIEK